ncbi:DUF3352 domain-containing protein [Janibacter terrae]|uniref:DUF3352 domain-containing protein n=1 Tax=Janibacter terrae TaxID=103817 RepID=UPI000829CA93|nr:DUF3352 domain-containing protein [Janibacter terrae]
MTQPPFGQPPAPGGQPPPPPGYGQPGYGQPVHGQYPGVPPQYPGVQQQPGQWGHQLPPQPAPSSRRALRWGALGVAGVLSLGLLGGGALFAYGKINGGGPQPETALPATAIAFAKVDLDPSADQKVDAFRFARKFPGARDELADIDEGSDLRQELFDAIKEDGGLEGVDYAQDVEPWLGQRFGVAVLPPTDGSSEPGVVVALASTDEDAARRGLSKVTGTGGYCSVQPDFAICGEEQSVVDTAVDEAQDSPLAEDDRFTQDMEDLGEDGLVTGWMDANRAQQLLGALGTGVSTTSEPVGRYAAAIRFDGPTLEIAGRANGLPDGSVPAGDGTAVGDLPADTFAALSISGLDESIRKAWPQFDKGARGSLGEDWQDGIDSFTQETGLSVPDDLAKAVGSETSLAVGPDADTPKVALVTNGDRGLIDKLVASVNSSTTGTGGTPQLTVKDADGNRTVVSTDAGYADQVATGSGLADADAFRDAVPDADKAGSVGYLDIAKAVELFGEDLGDEERANLGALKSAGFAVWGESDHADFRFRLTTS